MSEIKFRGKRKDNGEWVYGGIYEDANGQISIIDGMRGKTQFGYDKVETYFISRTPVVLESVGQSIGLKDKNGKKIYEGDIVRYTHKDLGHPVDYEVVFYEGAFLQENCPPRRLYKPNIWYEWEKLQVIGNIFQDDKDLLNTNTKTKKD